MANTLHAVLLNCPTCGLELPPDARACPRDATPVAVPVVPDDPLIGNQLGEYEVKRRVGVGGMGMVYEGLLPLIGKRVAIKVLRPEFAKDPQQVRRLLEEARAVNAIRHRGIVDIFGFGQVPTDGRHYIVMEYLEGQSLEDQIQAQGAMHPSDALPVLQEICSALSAAHGAGVIHRDLKPSNVFVVSQKDGSKYIKLLDFGLAKQGALPGVRSSQTVETAIMGTPDYMAPEQTVGDPASPQTDLYALGIVAFQMMTGRMPFAAPTLIELMSMQLKCPPPRPSELDASLPGAIDELVLHLLQKPPTARPGSAEEVRSELRRIERDLADAITRVQPRGKPVEKNGAEPETDAPLGPLGPPVPEEIPDAPTGRHASVADLAAAVLASGPATPNPPHAHGATPGELGPVRLDLPGPAATVDSLEAKDHTDRIHIPPRPGLSGWLFVGGGALLLAVGSALLVLWLRQPTPEPPTTIVPVAKAVTPRPAVPKVKPRPPPLEPAPKPPEEPRPVATTTATLPAPEEPPTRTPARTHRSPAARPRGPSKEQLLTEQLLKRIEVLEGRVRQTKNADPPNSAALGLLDGYRRDLLGSPSADTLKTVDTKVSGFERAFKEGLRDHSGSKKR